MKTLRHAYWLSGVVLFMLTIGISSSCKKGPEDPFFSIWSRKQRVVGNWNIIAYKVDFIDSLRRVVDSMVINGPCGLQTNKTIHYYSYRWSFDKEGNFTEVRKVRTEDIVDILIENVNCQDARAVDSVIVVTKKKWNFTGGIGDVKNKEQLMLYDDETKETIIYDIIMLRSNEMKLQTVVVDPLTNQATLRDYHMESIK